MENTLPTPEGLTPDERMAEVHQRLRIALDPQTGPEKSIVTWLFKWDRATLEPIADMIERAVDEHAIAVGEPYNLGYSDALKACRPWDVYAQGVAKGRQIALEQMDLDGIENLLRRLCERIEQLRGAS